MATNLENIRRYPVVTSNKTTAYISILPEGVRDEPQNQIITLTTRVNQGDTNIQVIGLSQPLAAGMALVFSGVGVTLYVAEDVAAAATNIKIKPAAANINNGEIAENIGKVRLIGGIHREISINANRRDSAMVFGDSSGYTDGGITESNWQINLEGNILEEDIGFHIISYGAFYAAQGRELFFWQEDFPSTQASFGNEFKGVVGVSKLVKKYQKDGIISFEATLTGRGILSSK